MRLFEFGYRTSERLKENADPKIQDFRKKCLKLSLTKKNPFAYIQNEEIDRWFSTFIAEVRRIDSDQYPPRNIHKLLSGILHSLIYEILQL